MRHVLFALALALLSAGAAFWMGRLSASGSSPSLEQAVVPSEKVLEERESTLEVAGLDAAFAGTSAAFAPANPPATSERAGTLKSAGKKEAAVAGRAKAAPRATDMLVVTKRERAVNVSRIGRPVGPDGITFEPVRSAAP